jgi:hypothetical protein
MTRFLGLSEAEMTENETMWSEEQGDVEAAPADATGLRSVGVTPGAISTDLDAATPPEGEGGIDTGAGLDASTGMNSPMGGAAQTSPMGSIPTPV